MVAFTTAILERVKDRIEHATAAQVHLNLARYYSNSAERNAVSASRVGHHVQQAFAHLERDPQPSLLNSAYLLRCLNEKNVNLPRAVGYCQSALEFAERSWGKEAVLLGDLLSVTADVHREVGDYQPALEFGKRGLLFHEQLFGANHELIAANHELLGWIYLELHQAQLAEASFRRVLDNLELRKEPNRYVAGTYPFGLGLALLDQGWPKRAWEEVEKGLRAVLRKEGPEGQTYAQGLWARGQVYERMKDDRALADYLQVVQLRDRPGIRPPDVAEGLMGLGRFRLKSKQWTKAREAFLDAIQVREKFSGGTHPQIGAALQGLAKAEHQLGDVTKAQQHLERALTICTERICDPECLPGLSFDLARAILETGCSGRL